MKMFFIILSLAATCCQGQSISFSLYSFDPCSGQVNQVKHFGLRKGSTTHSAKDSSGVITIFEPGEYQLSYVLDNIDTTQLEKVYRLNAFSTFSDTVSLVRIRECLEPISHPSFIGWCCCGKECDGTNVDFYHNGNKRIEGFFRNGRPVGLLKFYGPDGQIKEIRKYSKGGRLIKIVRK